MYKYLYIFTTIINIYLIERILVQKYFHVSLLHLFLFAPFCSEYLKYFKKEVWITLNFIYVFYATNLELNNEKTHKPNIEIQLPTF